jgi:TonB-linked SusC/RagA family outer membrane protein
MNNILIYDQYDYDIGFNKKKLQVKLLIFLVCIVSLNSTCVFAQNSSSFPEKMTITGVVIDADGIPITGATVAVTGTTIGTSTDVNGTYTLKNVPRGSTLSFSFIGYVKLEKKVGNENVINAILLEDVQSLQEVEIVAFGTQKKESVIGSITTISPGELKIPGSNLTTAFAGRIAGVISFQRTGEPGADDASFFIRGITTFGANTSPLILIDNIELTTTDLSRLQPDDIESFSVMKDATATALYGARGANGVILVKTKEGKTGKSKINFRFENSVSAPTKDVTLANPYAYMRLYNEAMLTRGLPEKYTEERIDNSAYGSLLYPITDWQSELLKNYTMNQRYNLNISGGGSVARYYVAASFSQDNGNLKVDKNNNFNSNIDLKTYTLRSNVNVDVTKSTELIVRLSGTFDDYNGPIDGGRVMYEKIMQTNPTLFPAKFPVDEAHSWVKHTMYGNADDGKYLNPYAHMVRGYKEYGRFNMGAQFEMKQKLDFITQGLSIRGLFNTNRTSYYESKWEMKPFYYKAIPSTQTEGGYMLERINNDGTEYLDFDRNGAKTIDATTYVEVSTNYDRKFGKHGTSGLLVYQLRNSSRPNAGDMQGSLPFRNVGLSGRFTYNFDNKYFSEFNFGYNGSERFSDKYRFGFFPSIGLGWMISNEKFFEPLKNDITKLKLRGSYGLVGNDKIGGGRFIYMSQVNMNDSGRGASFGEEKDAYRLNGMSVQRYADPEIFWEKSFKTNIALELELFHELNLIAEYYTEQRKSILQERKSIPYSMGLWVWPWKNLGEAKGRGVDFEMNYNKIMGKAWVQARVNLTYAKSEYTKFEDFDYGDALWKYKIGHSMSQQWGYIAEGLFIDDLHVQNSPTQFGEYVAGDIKYRDMNGDGQITEMDQVPIGYPTTPEIIYGFGASFGYKSWDFSFFFQGLGQESFWIDYNSVSPFFDTRGGDSKGNNALLQFIADNHWNEETRNTYAVWPRLSEYSIVNNEKKNTWFMRDGSFLRLKQLEFGYSLPESLIRKVGMSNLRIYFSGNNLLSFSSFKLWDPEMAGNGLGYPVQRVLNVGLNLSF